MSRDITNNLRVQASARRESVKALSERVQKKSQPDAFAVAKTENKISDFSPATVRKLDEDGLLRKASALAQQQDATRFRAYPNQHHTVTPDSAPPVAQYVLNKEQRAARLKAPLESNSKAGFNRHA